MRWREGGRPGVAVVTDMADGIGRSQRFTEPLDPIRLYATDLLRLPDDHSVAVTVRHASVRAEAPAIEFTDAVRGSRLASGGSAAARCIFARPGSVRRA
jgi:hypothetical protein